MSELLDKMAEEIALVRNRVSAVEGQLSKEIIPIAPGRGGTGTTTQMTQGSVVFAGASGVYSQDNDAAFWDNTAKRLEIGSSANGADFPRASGIFSKGDSGYTDTNNVGIIGEAAADATYVGIGLFGVAKTYGANVGTGLLGIGRVNASSDTALAIGLYGWSYMSHTGGNNVAVYADATGGSKNFSIYGANGLLYNAQNAMLGTTTDGMTAGGSIAIAQDLAHRGSKAGFYNATPATKQAVSGSRGGNAALASLITALATVGLITDSTSA